MSLDLARWRAQHYRDIHYALDFDLRAGTDSIEGSIEIRLTVAGNADDVVLDD